MEEEKASDLLERQIDRDVPIDEHKRKPCLEVPRGSQLWGGTAFGALDAERRRPFTHLRYTPVQSEKPINFSKDGYRLRFAEKDISVFIVVTMYNEDAKELQRTLTGICNNLTTFCAANGEDFWQHVAVCIVSDGRAKANKSTLRYAASQGMYDESLMEQAETDFRIKRTDVSMHLFEYSAQLPEDVNFKKHYLPLQTIFALKERNGGKLDSHLWFFNAFADQLAPKYCFLLDVGTQPRPRALFKLYRAMETNDQIAGVCGEIATYRPNMLNPVVASQHFEYKVSHILDKALESTMGFISVLPGAFSGYRFEAIRERDGKGPLVEYFKSITTPMKELGAFKANMYLAEDRILCFELIARRNCNWILAYVKNAVAETDVPEELHDLVKQRRRWLNGSFFATLYAIINFSRFLSESSHSIARKLVISVQFGYYVLNLVASWFLLANFYLAFFFLVTSPELFDEDYSGIGSVLNLGYLFLISMQVVMGLGNKPDEMKHVYSFASLFMGLFSLLTVILVTVYVLTTDNTILGLSADTIRWLNLMSLLSYFAAAVLHGEFAQICLSYVQYLFMLPTFINMFTIYSYCNIHDVSWGTKGIADDSHDKIQMAALTESAKDETLDFEQRTANRRQAERLAHQIKLRNDRLAEEKKVVEKEFKAFRSSLLIAWLGTNSLFAYLVGGLYVSSESYLAVLFLSVAFFLGLRLVGSITYLIDRQIWFVRRRFHKATVRDPLREDEEVGLSRTKCMHCRRLLQQNAQYCSWCGKKRV